MTKEEKDKLINILRKSLIKLHEVYNLEREGKVIVANEKLGGVIKILGAYGASIEADIEIENE